METIKIGKIIIEKYEDNGVPWVRMKNKAIKKAVREKEILAKEYSVSQSAIIWTGNNHYIIAKDGKEIKV